MTATELWPSLGSITGVLITIGFMVYRGYLMPRFTVNKLEKSWEAQMKLQKELFDQRLSDKDELIAELRKTNQAVDARNDMLADQVRQLVEVGRTSAAALSALPRTGGQ